VRSRWTKNPEHLSFWAKLSSALPYHIPRVLGATSLVLILLVGLLPSKGLVTGDAATEDKSSNVIAEMDRQEVLGITDRSELNTIKHEVKYKEADPELLGLKVPIIFYHYIRPLPDCTADKPGCSLSVTPEVFETQMAYLVKAGWTTITLDNLLAGFKNPKTLPPKPIIISFDDGYIDFYYSAWPILKKYNLKATIYVLSRGATLRPGFYLSEAMLRDLAADPNITIAAHTQDHLYLKGRSELIQRHEILGSKTELEAVTGHPVNHFAYPYGAFDDVTVRLVKEAGYKSAATTIIGTSNNEGTSLTLRRVRIGNLSLNWFAEQLAK
jgi:peptidoglycan/xylan/chitin deacetylase (PgdA/CDA1 family)